MTATTLKPVRKELTFGFAVFILIVVVAIIASGMMFFNLKLQMLMLCCWVVCAGFGRYLGFSYAELEAGAYEFIARAMGAVLIMMSVGALIGAWISAGTVAVMIYIGLKIITPEFFLATSFILCSMTSVFTGTSYGTIGTVGLALMGIGAGLGFDPGVTAATVISGAFLGDKMSPLSDTTNMAAAVNDVPLLTHVRHMANTLTPAFIITLIIYLFMGFHHDSGTGDASILNQLLEDITVNFRLGFIPAIPMLLVFYLLLRQTNPILAIISGSVLGVAVAVGYAGVDLTASFNAMWSGYEKTFDNPLLMKLMNRGGVTSMLGVSALVIFACGLGGMLRCLGVIDTILEPVSRHAKSAFSLVLSTLVIGFSTVLLTASSYFSLLMTGTIMTPLFRKQGYRPENCSRVTEDVGTLATPLVPWSSNALFSMGMLGVGFTDYAPYCFLMFLMPCVSLTYSILDINMTRLSNGERLADDQAQEQPEQVSA